MVSQIPEEDWKDQVQIIGWLYQYYNSEPKDKVFADLKKNVKISKENIPAATQLFTPDWIVRYMVENSLGRLWAEGHEKPANADWKYYLEEAQQEESVKAELNKLRAEYAQIKPEQIKFLDPCMGSGHILVYAFDLLMSIYTQQGWSERDAAVSIITKNLYGLDIDRRAYQLAYFSLMMKARQYCRRLFEHSAKGECSPNLANFQDIGRFSTDMLTGKIAQLAGQFENCDTYGSLIDVQEIQGLDEAIDEFHGVIGFNAQQLERMMQLYKILSQQYDVVCTNPPYMGGSGMNSTLSEFVKNHYPYSKSDLFACFIEQCGKLTKNNGFYAMITQHAWMFISSYELFRMEMLKSGIVSMIHLGIKAFEEIGNDVVQTCSFIIKRRIIPNYKSTYIKLTDYKNYSLKDKEYHNIKNHYYCSSELFRRIPGIPIAYWVSDQFVNNFTVGKRIEAFGTFTGSQNITGDNEKFLRYFWEVKNKAINHRWRFYAKGGDYRQYYGNLDLVVDWSESARCFYKTNKTSNLLNESLWFLEGITYSAVTSRGTGFRYLPKGCIFDKGGPSINIKKNISEILAILNSNVAKYYFWVFNPSINLQVKDVKSLPIIIPNSTIIAEKSDECTELCRTDWDSFETSWDFERHPLV